jgi:hypothetical protein
MSLEQAGAVFGITANAMRARAKKNPEAYGLERDNSGKLWVTFDPDHVPAFRPLKPLRGRPSPGVLVPVLQQEIVELKAQRDAAFRARDVAEADRDRWQAMAERLASRRWSWWPWS